MRLHRTCLVLLLCTMRSQSQLPQGQSTVDHDLVMVSPQLAIDRKLALQGGAVEQLRYARDLNDGILARRNYEEAFKWFKSSSNLGSSEATSWLGSMYLLGTGVSRDLETARSLIVAGAVDNDKIAFRFLGMMYEEGLGEPQDYKQALSAYIRASQLGDGYSFDRRGLLRLRGLGVARSPRLAFFLFEKGANLGDQWAQLDLGKMYKQGIGFTKEASVASPRPDFAAATHWLELSAAQNNRVALYVLGQMAKAGLGREANDSLAFQYFELSASHMYAPADVALGLAHEEGRGVARNLLHAYVGYALAAERGNEEGGEHLRSLSLRLSVQEAQQARQLLATFKQLSGEGPQIEKIQ